MPTNINVSLSLGTPAEFFPRGYQQARHRFSENFLYMFDKKLKESEPGWGTYLMALCFFPFFPIIIWLSQWYYGQVRTELYNNLLSLSHDPQRRQIVEQESCIDALRENILEINHVTSCPMSSLEFMLKPETLNRLKQDAAQIKQQRSTLQSELSSMQRRESDLKMRNQVDPQLQNMIILKREQLDQTKTIVKKLARENFSEEALNRLLPAQDFRTYPFQPFRRR